MSRPTQFFFLVLTLSTCLVNMTPSGVISEWQNSTVLKTPHAVMNIHGTIEDLRLIEPGIRVGPLKLGDSQERALELFPKKPNIDQETFLPNCGTEYIWSDLDDPSHGTIMMRFKKDRVWQIESVSANYHTRDGIAVGDSPDRVRESYKGLSAFLLLGPMPEVFGERPLIFWTDQEKGIAFAFAYSRANRERYLYKIIVYAPKSTFCPEGEEMSPKNWREMVPYALEPADRMASF
jgi:hypothetical protein